MDNDRGLEIYGLSLFMDGAVGGLNRPLRARPLSGGWSNPTYIVVDGVREWVPRRPPTGVVLASAHDMGREVRVLRALHGTAVPVPAVIAHDLAGVVLGVPVYVMERVEGEVIGSVADAARLEPEQRRRLGEAMVDVLAALHTVEVDQVGLSDWGKPTGFLERQLLVWRRQWDAVRTRERPEFPNLLHRLSPPVPPPRRTAVFPA